MVGLSAGVDDRVVANLQQGQDAPSSPRDYRLNVPAAITEHNRPRNLVEGTGSVRFGVFAPETLDLDDLLARSSPCSTGGIGERRSTGGGGGGVSSCQEDLIQLDELFTCTSATAARVGAGQHLGGGVCGGIVGGGSRTGDSGGGWSGVGAVATSSALVGTSADALTDLESLFGAWPAQGHGGGACVGGGSSSSGRGGLEVGDAPNRHAAAGAHLLYSGATAGAEGRTHVQYAQKSGSDVFAELDSLFGPAPSLLQKH